MITKISKKKSLILLICVAMIFAAMPATAFGADTSEAVKVSGISLNYTSAELSTGETLQLTATVSPSNATNQNIIWKSSDDSIATVDSNGKVTAIKFGRVTIMATTEDGKYSQYCQLQNYFYDAVEGVTDTYGNNSITANIAKSINWMAETGISTGYDKINFGSYRETSRADFVIFLWRYAGKPAANSKNIKSFNDIEGVYGKTSATYQAIAWASSNGIINGYSDGTFKPKESVTRGQVAIMLWKHEGKPSTSATSTFPDVKVDSKKGITANMVTAINWAQTKGLVSGYSSGPYAGTFQPLGTCYRFQMAIIVWRYAEKPSYSLTYVGVPSVVLHTSASNSSSTITIPYMTELVITSKTSTNAWNKVYYGGKTYYLWIDSGATPLTSTKSTYDYTGTTEIQQEIVNLAKYICFNWDTTYGHGDSSGVASSSGVYTFDCSGFASYVLDTVMTEYVPVYNVSANLKTLYNTTSIYNSGYNNELKVQTISASNLQPGDILFFNISAEADSTNSASNGYTHCGIYVGNGEFIHATHSWNDVCVMPLSDMYTETLVAIKRYVPTKAVPSSETLSITGTGDCKVYGVKDSNTEVVKHLGGSGTVTLQYYNNGNWAYVEYEDGKYGYVLIKYLTK